MTKQEAKDLEMQIENLLTENFEAESTIALTFSGYFRIAFDENYICVKPDGLKIGYVKFTGFKEDLEDFCNKALLIIRQNKELFDQLLWSYEHIGELM